MVPDKTCQRTVLPTFADPVNPVQEEPPQGERQPSAAGRAQMLVKINGRSYSNGPRQGNEPPPGLSKRRRLSTTGSRATPNTANRAAEARRIDDVTELQRIEVECHKLLSEQEAHLRSMETAMAFLKRLLDSSDKDYRWNEIDRKLAGFILTVYHDRRGSYASKGMRLRELVQQYKHISAGIV